MRPSVGLRVRAYERAGRALQGFFSAWTSAFCARCVEVTRLAHPSLAAADVEVLEGVFAGCCQAGVADGYWIPGLGDEGRFPPEMVEALEGARRHLCPRRPLPPRFRVRERRTGRVATGVGCAYLSPNGCVLGPWRAPLCFGFLCAGPARALAGALGLPEPGGDTDDFAGARGVFAAVVFGDPQEADGAVSDLERRLQGWHATLERRFGTGEGLYRWWRGQENAKGS